MKTKLYDKCKLMKANLTDEVKTAIAINGLFG